MNRRIEQRFQVYSPAKVVLLDDPERELACLLTDISGMGLRLLAAEALPRDTMIAVELEDHLVLCDVRNSEARGDRYAIGAEKVHTLSKLEVGADLKPVEKIQALVTDFHRRLRSELETSKPAVSAASEPPEEAAPVPVVEEIASIPATVPSGIGLEPRITDVPPFIPPQARLALPGPPRAGMAQFASVLAESAKTETPSPVAQKPVVEEFVAPEIEPPAVPVLAGPEPVEPVDPAQPSYRVPVTPFQRRLLRTWSIVIGLIAGLVMLGAEELLYRPFRVDAQASPATHTTPPIQPAPAVSLPVVTMEEPEKPIAAPQGKRHIAVTITSNTWLTACIDGTMTISTLLVPNSTRGIDFERIAWLRFGNAGGAQLSLDGKSLGPVGDPGMVRDVELTTEGFKFLTPLGDSSHCPAAQIAER